MPTDQRPPLVIIGGGNMAQAILRGALGRVLDPARVCVAEPDQPKHPLLVSLGVVVRSSALDALAWLQKTGDARGQVMLAVKPQQLAEVARELTAADPRPRWTVITILAGMPSIKVRAALGGQVRVIRAMPNLPSSILQGVTAVALGAGAEPGDEALAMDVFAGIGPVVLRMEESMMDAVTAVAASGPAYVFYLAEAMIQAAMSIGFQPDQARAVVAQTILGAGAMLAKLEADPAALRASVTSKGGTTAAAIAVMQGQGVGESVIAAVVAARDRGRELANA